MKILHIFTHCTSACVFLYIMNVCIHACKYILLSICAFGDLIKDCPNSQVITCDSTNWSLIEQAKKLDRIWSKKVLHFQFGFLLLGCCLSNMYSLPTNLDWEYSTILYICPLDLFLQKMYCSYLFMAFCITTINYLFLVVIEISLVVTLRKETYLFTRDWNALGGVGQGLMLKSFVFIVYRYSILSRLSFASSVDSKEDAIWLPFILSTFFRVFSILTSFLTFHSS